MNNLSTGTGLAILAGAIVAWPVLDRLMPNANAVGVGPTAVSAVAAAATAQGAPTIVWYQAFARDVASSAFRRSDGFWVVRAWSDGKIEARWVFAGGADGGPERKRLVLPGAGPGQPRGFSLRGGSVGPRRNPVAAAAPEEGRGQRPTRRSGERRKRLWGWAADGSDS